MPTPVRCAKFVFQFLLSSARLSALLTTRLPPTAAQAVLPAARKRVFRLSGVLCQRGQCLGRQAQPCVRRAQGFFFRPRQFGLAAFLQFGQQFFSPALSPLWPIRCLHRPCVPVLLPVRKPACFLPAFPWHEAPKKVNRQTVITSELCFFLKHLRR